MRSNETHISFLKKPKTRTYIFICTKRLQTRNCMTLAHIAHILIHTYTTHTHSTKGQSEICQNISTAYDAPVLVLWRISVLIRCHFSNVYKTILRVVRVVFVPFMDQIDTSSNHYYLIGLFEKNNNVGKLLAFDRNI